MFSSNSWFHQSFFYRGLSINSGNRKFYFVYSTCTDLPTAMQKINNINSWMLRILSCYAIVIYTLDPRRLVSRTAQHRERCDTNPYIIIRLLYFPYNIVTAYCLVFTQFRKGNRLTAITFTMFYLNSWLYYSCVLKERNSNSILLFLIVRYWISFFGQRNKHINAHSSIKKI